MLYLGAPTFLAYWPLTAIATANKAAAIAPHEITPAQYRILWDLRITVGETGMRRIYFLLPEEHSRQTIVNELLLMRVEWRHIHTIANGSTERDPAPPFGRH